MANYFNNNQRRDNKSQEKEPSFSEEYLKNGYYSMVDGEQVMHVGLVTYKAKEIADDLNCRVNKKDGLNKRSQIRKFYEYVISIESLVKRKGRFDVYEADLKKLIASAVYAKTRKVVSQYFVDFINSNLDKVKSEKDLFAFSKHFEAVVAYLPKEK